MADLPEEQQSQQVPRLVEIELSEHLNQQLEISHQEALVLAREMEELHQIAQEFGLEIERQDHLVEEIAQDVQQTEVAVSSGNLELLQVTRMKGRNNIFRNAVGGLLGGTGVGAAIGLHFGGLGAIPGFIG